VTWNNLEGFVSEIHKTIPRGEFIQMTKMIIFVDHEIRNSSEKLFRSPAINVLSDSFRKYSEDFSIKSPVATSPPQCQAKETTTSNLENLLQDQNPGFDLFQE
jgi:hypothetical protein